MATEELQLDGVDHAGASTEEIASDQVLADDLVEDVSIDGMCGVY